MHGSTFTFAKILIDICQYPYIQGSVFLSTESNGFDMYVKEVERLNHWTNDKVVHWVASMGASNESSVGIKIVETNCHSLIINTKNQSLMALNGRGTSRALGFDGANIIPKTTCMDEEIIAIGSGGKSNNRGKSHTIGLDDDRLSQEVVKDFDLAQTRPNENSFIANAYRE